MYIHRDGFLFRVGYMFTPRESEPAQVDRCTLVTRFVLWFVPWIMANLVAWVVLGLLFGIVAQILTRIVLFLATGEKVVYRGNDANAGDYLWEWLIGRRALCKLCIFGYERRNIHFFDFLDTFHRDMPRSPIIFAFVVLVTLAFIALILFYLPYVFMAVVGFFSFGGALAYETFGWWGSALGIVVAALFAYHLIRKAQQRIVATESGKVLASHIKEWKSAHCPIYEVIRE